METTAARRRYGHHAVLGPGRTVFFDPSAEETTFQRGRGVDEEDDGAALRFWPPRLAVRGDEMKTHPASVRVVTLPGG